MAGNSLNFDGRISLDDYKRNSPQNAHQRRRLRVINNLISEIPVPGKCLDYGCGLGDLTFRVSSNFDEIIGVDVTQERIEWANKEFAPIKFYQCNETDLDFPESTFDTVLSSVVINWVDDQDNYLQNIASVLKPDGYLVLVVLAPDRIRNIFRKVTGKEPDARNLRNELSRMESRLHDAGFDIVRKDYYFDPLRDEMTNFKNVFIQLLKLPMRIAGSIKYASYYGILARNKKNHPTS